MTPGPSGAQCAIHAGVPAPSVCARCGNFMCLACSENGSQTQCPACRPRTASSFPLDANADLGTIWNYVLARFTQEWLMLSVGLLIFLAIAMVGGVFTSLISKIVNAIIGLKLDPVQPWRNMRDFLISQGVVQLISPFIQMPIQGIGLLGVYRLMIDVLHGRKADVGRMFMQLHLLGRYVVMQLIIHVVITIPLMLMWAFFGFVALRTAGVSVDQLGHSDSMNVLMLSAGPLIFLAGTVLFIVLAIVVAPVTLFAAPELLVSECQPMEAISRAWKMGEGNRLRVFGYALLTGVVAMVGVLACCVGVIPATALGYTLLICLFLVIRKAHADLPPIIEK